MVDDAIPRGEPGADAGDDGPEPDLRPARAPGCWRTLAESRAVYEAGAFLAASPVLRLLGRGDRHPVLVLPGFTATDRSTEALRWFLRGQGYWVHGWSLGRNLGPTQETLDGLDARLRYVAGRHRRPVSLVGWSLGGIYARELARRHPELTRQVITLGSPFRMHPDRDRSNASRMWEAVKPGFAPELGTLLVPEARKAVLTVPATSIYSRRDGVVAWHTCLESDGPLRENIEVTGTHNGMGWNPAVLYAIADRLAQPEGDWRPFQAPLVLRRWYPRPVSYDVARRRRTPAA
jgi:pimeloyl-ACP methyl ester carboxylesterase